METLDRALVAIKTTKGVYTSWRIPGDEYYGVTYNLYRDGSLIAEGLNVSNYLDDSGSLTNTYAVAPVTGGVEGAKSTSTSVWKSQYLQVDLQPVINPATGRDVTSVMSVTDGTVADLDGDGQYELILERQNTDFTVCNDSAYTRFEAYRLDGTKLWSVNLGPNMRDGNGSENACYAFDFDEDGKAEIIFRGGDGTILPDGTVLGNASVNYRTDFTGTQAYMENGNEYIVMLDGETGSTLDYQIFDSNDGGYNKTTNNKTCPSGVYEPGTSAPGNNLARRSVAFWYGGSSKSDGGHRATKFYFGAPYLDGRHPSVYIGRGCYTNYHGATWDVVNKKLVLKWACAVDDTSSEFYGQGYHNFTIADVDMDGRDEICQGNMVVDEYGKFHSSTGLGHGDALHFGDLDPFRDGVESFRCLEENAGAVFVDADSNEILFRWKRGSDCGRAMAGNFTNKFPGAQLWTVDGNLWSASTTRDAEDRVATTAPGVSMNARIYWDGDLLEECLDGVSTSNYQVYDMKVTKYGSTDPIFQTSGCLGINSTKANPCVQADILGDWREEIVVPTSDNKSVRIYTTTYETSVRNYTLMHDPQYRQAVYWQSTGYNQPPHVSYFLGDLEGILLPPPPSVTNGKELLGTSLTSATDGKFVAGVETSDRTVSVSGTVSPAYLQINTPADYTLSGGTWTGTTTLLKQGQGTLTLDAGVYNQTGPTEVWYGALDVKTDYTSSPVALKRFAKLSSSSALGNVSMEYGATVYPGGASVIGTMKTQTLSMQGGAILEMDMANDGSSFDQLTVDSLIIGSANCIGATPTFYIRRTASGTLASGTYVLVTATKGISGDVSTLTLDGLKGLSASLQQVGNTIVLSVEDMRVATDIVYSGKGDWDLNKSESFLIDDQSVTFVTGDCVTLDATSADVTINVAEDVEPGSLTIIGNHNVTIQGTGSIGGSCKLVKKGSGTLTIQTTNSYTGGTRIEDGIVKISSIASLQNGGALGAYSPDKANIYIGTGATLWGTSAITNANAIQLGDSSCLYTAGNWVQQAALTGGRLVKQGSGTLSFETVPTAKKVEIQEGIFKTMSTVSNCLGDTVILRGGTLTFDDNANTYGNQSTPWVVPAGCSATVNVDRRCVYSNVLKGSGTLTINLPNDTSCPRTNFTGNWSAFEGSIKVVTPNTGRPLSFNNTYGLPKATVNIATAGHTIQLGGDGKTTTGSFRIGALTGRGTLAAGSSTSNYFEVGSLNKDFTFAGISNAALHKIGTGTMTMTGNTGSGAITVNAGTLKASNTTSSTTSATGTGGLTVNNGGRLTGKGYVANKIVIKSGGVFAPGNNYASTLKTGSSVEVQNGGVLEFRINGKTSSTPCSNVTIGKELILKGTLRILENEGVTYSEGDSYTFYTCSKYSSNTSLATLEFPTLADGLAWNTDALLGTTGALTIVADASALDEIEASAPVCVTLFTLDGKPLAQYQTEYGNVQTTLQSDASLAKGMYLVSVESNGQAIERRLYTKR